MEELETSASEPGNHYYQLAEEPARHIISGDDEDPDGPYNPDRQPCRPLPNSGAGSIALQQEAQVNPGTQPPLSHPSPESYIEMSSSQSLLL